MSSTNEEHILDSWQSNADAWTRAVRENQIESRKLVTDRAIVEAVMSVAPRTLLDTGCGEGWLSRELSRRGIDVLGIDAVEALIVEARRAGGARYTQLSYGELAAGHLAERFDAVVCNFSLFGEESVDDLFSALPGMLNPGGAVIVQTLHPVSSCGDAPYRDGWRTGSWQGFSDDFFDPAPWFFRTLSSWVALFTHRGFQIAELREPVFPHAQIPASLILVARLPV